MSEIIHYNGFAHYPLCGDSTSFSHQLTKVPEAVTCVACRRYTIVRVAIDREYKEWKKMEKEIEKQFNERKES